MIFSFYFAEGVYYFTGYGACLIHKPDLLHSMVRSTRNAVPNPDFTVSVKIRIHDDTRYYVIRN